MVKFLEGSPARDQASMRSLLLVTTKSLFLLLLSACGGADYRPYPYVDRLEVVASTTVGDTPTALSKGDVANTIPKETAKTTSVAAGFGLGLSLVCGPMFATCAGFLVPAFAVPQLVVTPVTGGVAVLGSMTREEADQFNAYFEDLPKRRNLNQELVIAVSAAVPATRLATTNGDALLALGMERIQIRPAEINHRYSLTLSVGAYMEWDRGKQPPNNTKRNYNCDTDYQTPTEWLADSGRSLDEAINLCLRKIAKQVNTAVDSNSGNRPV